MAVLQDGKIEVRRVAGKVEALEKLIKEKLVYGTTGIGHTRWATHGAPSELNAHPHLSASGKIVLVHNGIVENYLSLKEELVAEGIEFKSETDTETIVNLIEIFYGQTEDLSSAVQKTMAMLKGSHGMVVLSTNEPDKLIAARLGNAGGVAIGIGEDEMFIGSDIPAIVAHTRRMVFLESGQLAVVKRDGF